MERTAEMPGLVLKTRAESGLALTSIQNWDDASETVRNSELRENGFGLYRDDDPSENGRFPIVYGHLLARSEDEIWAVRAAIMALKNLPTFDLSVTDSTGTWRAEVSISGQIVFTVQDETYCLFEIPLEASDPRKYGPSEILSVGPPTAGVGMSDPFTDPFDEGAAGNPGRAVCVNLGSAPTEPVVKIYGGVSDGFELLCLETARVVRVTRPIPDGSFVTVDHSTGEVWIDDQSLLPATYVPISEWFQIKAGETCTIQWAPLGTLSGSPRMVVEFAGASW